MSETEWKHDSIARDAASDQLVRDVMVRRPKTMAADATVAELPDDAPATDPARDYARLDVPTLPPDATMAEALTLLDSRGDFRLVVLDADGRTLAGLLCLDRNRAGFCTYVPAQAP